MKVPGEIKTYCKSCNAHTAHKAKNVSKGTNRSLAKGNRKHERRLAGQGGKRRGKASVKKQGKKQIVVLACSKCNKKSQKIVGTRTRKKIEVKR